MKVPEKVQAGQSHHDIYWFSQFRSSILTNAGSFSSRLRAKGLISSQQGAQRFNLKARHYHCEQLKLSEEGWQITHVQQVTEEVCLPTNC